MKTTLYMICALFCLGFASCQRSSYEDFKEKGQEKTQTLVQELKSIRTRDQLIARESKLKAAFLDLATLSQQVKHYQETHPEEKIPELTQEDKKLSDSLRIEILRIYRLDGGREVLDRLRSDSLKPSN